MKDTIKKSNRLACLVLLLTWLIPVLFFCKFGRSLLDADMASEMVLAKQLNDEGTLISTNWSYSTEIRILAQEIFFKIGLFFFPDRWDLVRIFTQALLLLATALSYLYMTGILPNRRKNVYFAAMLLCPFGFWHMFHNIFDGFYLLHMIFYMLCAGLVFRISLENKHSILRFILLIFLCFEQGLEGVRLLMNLYVPLILVSLLILYFRIRDLNGVFNRKQLHRELKLLAASVCSLVFAAAGYFINIFVLSNHFHYLTQASIAYTKFSLGRILEVLSTFLRIFGYPIEDLSSNSEFLLSIPGVLSAFSLILMAMVCFSMIRTAKRLPSLSLEERLLVITCLSSFLVTIVVFSITDYNYNGSYFLPFLPAIIALISIEWETEHFQLKYGRALSAWILALSVICCSLSTMRAFKNYPPRARKDIIRLTEAILEKGYTQGVASFWYGNVVAELSNGKIEMWEIQDFKTLRRKEILQSLDHFLELPTGRGVFIVDSTEMYFDYFINVPDSELIYDRYGVKIVGVEEMQTVFEDIQRVYGSGN